MTTLGELLYALVAPLPPDAGEAYSMVAGGSLFELYGGDGHADCNLSVYCRNPLHPGPCKGWKKHLGLTAPGVLSALEKAQKEKLAISRAKRAAAKSEAEKIVHGKLGHSAHPLFQKQLTVKHAKTILTGDENKAVQQASKVILNKTEIKRYSKLKAAQIAANGGQWAGVADQAAFSKSLETQIANALALDSSEGSTHHLTNLLSDTSDALAAQLTNRQMPGCAKGDHDCDGLAYESLKDHLSTSLFRGLRDGNMDEANRQAGEVKALGGDPAKIRDWLKKEGVDLKAPEMDVTPPESKLAKVGAPVYTTLKGAGLKPGDKVHLHVVSHDGKKYVASTSDVKGANTHTAQVTVDASNGGKTVFHDDETGEKIAGGYSAKKYFLTQAEGHPMAKAEQPQSKSTAAKVDQQLNAPDKLGQKLDEAFGSPPTKAAPKPKADKNNPMAVLTNEQLVNGLKMKGADSPGGKVIANELAKRGLDHDGNPLGAAQPKVKGKTLEQAGIQAGDVALLQASPGAPAIPVKVSKQGFGYAFHDAKGNQVKVSSTHTMHLIDKANEHTAAKFEEAHTTHLIDKAKPNDLTPNEAAPSVPKATEWVQPEKHAGWISDGDMTDVLSGTYKPMTDQQQEDWLASVSYLPKSQFESVSPSAQDKILTKLTEIHNVDLATGDLDHADQVEDVYKKHSGGLGFPAMAYEPPPVEAAPGEPPFNILANTVDVGSNTSAMLSLQSHPELYPDLSDEQKAKIKGVLQAKYLIGTPEESGIAQSLAVLHKIDLTDQGGEADPFEQPFGGAPKSEALTKLLEHATPKEQGGKWALAKTKLPLYQGLGDDELVNLSPEEKNLLMKDLSDMALKFKDPKKIAMVAGIQNKISKAHGGGAGAGGTSHVETPGHTEINTPSTASSLKAAEGTDKVLESVAKLTGVEAPGTMKEAIAAKVAQMIEDQDAAGLLKASGGPATAITTHVVSNNSLLEPHKDELKTALAQDLTHVLQQDGVATPVLDAVNKWGKTKQLKANAAAKIVAALKDHPSLAGEPHVGGPSDAVLGHELAKHAGEVAAPSMFDPGDYPGISNWLGKHALDNAQIDVGLTANELFSLPSPGIVGKTLDDAENTIKADYLNALFDGKTKPGGLAGELPGIIESTNQQHAAMSAKSGWKDDSPASQAGKAGIFYAELSKALGGKSAGTGGSSTEVPAQVKKAVAEAITPAGELSDGQKVSLKQAYKSFGSTSYLKESTEQQNFDNLLAVASAYSGEEGMGQLTFGKVMDAIDEQMASELGVVNGKLLRKKITDWLQTPSGKNYADTASPKGQLLTQLTGKIAEQKELAQWKEKNALPKYPGPGAFDTSKQPGDFTAHTVASSKALHDATLKKLGKKISPAQQQAVTSYTGSGASYMNDWLRHGTTYGGINTIKEAHLVAEAMFPIAEDMKLLRRTGWEFVPPQFRSYEAIQKLIGGTFHDPAFMSTTTFAQPGSYGKSLPVELHIEAPKGTQGFHADHISHFKGTENEFLLGAGQTLQVMGVRKKGTKVVVDVRVVTE